jgi:glycerol kinase
MGFLLIFWKASHTMSILAIDQGTTSTRALTVDVSGRAEIIAVTRHTQYYPKSGWVEHDPEELIGNITRSLEAADNVTAVGMDNQGESCLAWDADTGKAISPVIVWQDNRTVAMIERMKREGLEAEIMERSGLPLDSYFSASKFAWIMAQLPQAKKLLAQGRLRLGTTDAFFLDRLTGHFISDITTASRTSLMNIRTGQWDPELCRMFGVPAEALPAIVPTTGELGHLQCRNRKIIPVLASVVDQQASLYGHGCRKPGDAKITFGTGAFALALTGRQLLQSPEQGMLPTIAWQHSATAPTYALDGGVYCAGSAIEWAKKLGLFSDYASINAFERASAIERDLAFVPALTGLACPHWDRRAAGIWIGLALDTDAADMMQSLLEGIAFRAAEVIRAMSTLANIGECISVDGGVSVNAYFCQFLADVLEKSVAVKSFPEITAIGTAQLAGAGDVRPDETGQSIKLYHPAQDRAAHRGKFSEAVSRAQGWRNGG